MKYWKMLGMGLPLGAAKQACMRDGKSRYSPIYFKKV